MINIDGCPFCNTKLNYNSKEIGVCSNCGQDLKSCNCSPQRATVSPRPMFNRTVLIKPKTDKPHNEMCPECKNITYVKQEKCGHCVVCGYSACSL